MTRECEKLTAFAEGQLSVQEREAFYPHFASCSRCQRALEEHIAIDLTAAMNRRRFAGIRRMMRRIAVAVSRRPFASALVPIAAAAMVLIVSKLQVPHETTDLGSAELVAALTPVKTRPFLGAPAHPAASGYWATSDVQLGDPRHESKPVASATHSGASGNPGSDSERLEDIAFSLKKKEDHYGSGIAYLFAGKYEDAAKQLEKVAPTPEVLNDRAVAALALKHWEEALALADQSLRQRPDLWQAHWNRGVALRQLQLRFAAERAFALVKAPAAHGWLREAAEHAAHKEDLRRRDDWGTAYRQAFGMAFNDGPPVDQTQASSHPDLATRFLYAALRSAETLDRVRELEGLANRLGNKHLLRVIAQIKSEDFEKRRRLAVAYKNLGRQLPPPADRVAALLADARTAKQRDLEIGAIALSSPDKLDAGELERLLSTEADPWNRYLLVNKLAETAQAHDDVLGAESKLLEALLDCHKSGADYRCTEMRHALANIETRLHRPVEARVQAEKGLAHARQLGEWGIERSFLADLAAAARFNSQIPLARAFIEEMLAAQDPPDVPTLTYTLVESARLALEEGRPELAYRNLQGVPQTAGMSPPLSALEAWSDLSHWEKFPIRGEEESEVLKHIDALRRRSPAEEADRIVADTFEGRMVIRHDPGRGRGLLERAIKTADASLRMTVDIRKYRAAAYSALIQRAASDGQFGEALARLGEELQVPVPKACVFGIASDYDKFVFVARDSAGLTKGVYWPHHDSSSGDIPPLPADIEGALAACKTVDVIARPPFQGQALLDPNMAWRFLVKHAERAFSGPPSVRTHLIVTSPVPPEWLGLTPLKSWGELPTIEDTEVKMLSGEAATPAKVLGAMVDASEIDINAHGTLNLGISDVSYLALSPDARGDYALKASDVRAQHLRYAPLVILASCSAATPSLRYHEQWSLPIAFIEAGAGAVIASPMLLAQDEAESFFAEVRKKWRDGSPPAIALRDARRNWINQGKGELVKNVVIFE